MAKLNMTDLHKSYGSVPVILGVSIDIRDGEFVTLVGPSGCGKSTLLRMIAGLEAITEGDISIGERRVNDLSPKDRNIAMVFQSYALYPHKTVEQNMGYALKLAGKSKAEVAKAVGHAAEILNLTPLLSRKPSQLSGGQRQRVAMGRAIVRDPDVFLFDEPLSNLDAKLRVQMRSEIRALHQRLKTTTVYVTHDQIEAMTMADRIVVMNNGIVEQNGPPLELYDRPANKFVAGFLGSPAMNFFDGVTFKTATGWRFRVEDGSEIPLPAPPPDAVADTNATLGFRPEHLAVGAETKSSFTVSVVTVEPTGAETQIGATFAGKDLSIVVKERMDITFGTDIPVALQKDEYHFFDANSSIRVKA